MTPPFSTMKTFIRLVPASREAGRFSCPRSPDGAGLQLNRAGLGYVWWRPSTRIDPALLVHLPTSLATLIFSAFETERLSLWIKFPWREPTINSLLMVVSVRLRNGTHLNLGWSPQTQTRADAVEFLATCPALDAAWIGEEQALLDQRHGRIVSIEHYDVSEFIKTLDREAA